MNIPGVLLKSGLPINKLIDLWNLGYPVDYLVKSELKINDLFIEYDQNCFLPRAETLDFSQLLIKNYSDFFRNKLVVEICCGTGFLGLSVTDLAKKSIFIDIDKNVIKNLQKSLKHKEKLLEKTEIFCLDVLSLDLLDLINSYFLFKKDLVNINNFKFQKDWVLISNPPYVPDWLYPESLESRIYWEPYNAIYSQFDGLGFFRNMLRYFYKKQILPEIWILELDILNIFQAQNMLLEIYPKVDLIYDIYNKPRFLIARIE